MKIFSFFLNGQWAQELTDSAIWLLRMQWARETPGWVKEPRDRGTWCLPGPGNQLIVFLFLCDYTTWLLRTLWAREPPGSTCYLGVRKTAWVGQRATWSRYLMFTWAQEPPYWVPLWFYFLVIENTMGPGTAWSLVLLLGVRKAAWWCNRAAWGQIVSPWLEDKVDCGIGLRSTLA